MIPGTIALGGGGSGKEVSFQEARHSAANDFTFTFSNVNIGFADPTRLVVVGVHYYEFDTSVVLNSITIGGSSLSSVVSSSALVSGGSGSYIYSAIRSRAVSTGTTATISLSFSRAINLGCSIGVWSLYGLNSNTAVSTDAYSGAFDMSFTTQPDDIIIAALTGVNTAGPTTWTNISENYDTVSNSLSRSGASTQAISSGTLLVRGSNTLGTELSVGAQWR